MLLSYQDCIKRYGTNYKLNQQVKYGNLFKLEKGIYSEQKYASEIELLTFKYPEAIFTLNSAFYFYSLTDVIPENYVMATERNAAKMKDRRVLQVFCDKAYLEIGKVSMDYLQSKISIYNRERLLIELIRYKNKLPFDYYKEIILAYRNQVMDLDMELIEHYVEQFPRNRKIMNVIQAEVF